MKGRRYVAYSIVASLAEQAAVAIVWLWVLPKFDLELPLWGLVLLMAGVAAYSGVVTGLNKRALDQRAVIQPDVGARGRTATILDPEGYVRVGGELWKALAAGGPVGPRQEVTVIGMKGMTLLVSPRGGAGTGQAERGA
jgi:membrane protein implicated in regulation of membrane protease activity